MKALTLRQIKTPLEMEDRPELVPAADEVVIQLAAAGLNRRDYWITQGLYPGIRLPVVLGSDGAGTVIQTGSGLGNYWQGREVVINPGFDWGDRPSVQSSEFTVLGMPRDGTFATQVALPAKQLHAKPSHLSWQEAAVLALGGTTAYRAVFSQGTLQPHETVLITGIGGGVATFALQFAVAAGAAVWVTSSSDEKIERAIELGAQGGFNYTDANWADDVARQAGAPDLIVDSAGGANYNRLINVAAPGGRIVNYGATAGAPEKLDLFKVFWKQLRLQGSTMGSPADFTSMMQLVEQHRIHPVVDGEFPLAEGNSALEQMQSSPQFGKYVLVTDSA